MIFRRSRNGDPSRSCILGCQHASTRPRGKGALAIQDVKAVECRNQARRLVFPSKAAVRGIENHAVRAHRPAVQLVAGETNRTDRIALGQRVLPFPSAIGGLSECIWPSAKRSNGEYDSCQEERPALTKGFCRF